MPRIRRPGPLAIFYWTVAAVLTTVWVYGFYQYWWLNWGIDTPMAAGLVTAWWPFMAIYYGSLLLLENRKKVGVAGVIVWGMLPFWPFMAYIGYAPKLFDVNHRWNAVVLGWYPALVGLVLLVKYFTGTRRTVRAAGRFINAYFKPIIILLGLATGVLLFVGVMWTLWVLVLIAIGIVALMFIMNWVRTIAIGFKDADSGFAPGEIIEVKDPYGNVIAPQRIHPVGVVAIMFSYTRNKMWANPVLGEWLPGKARFVWNVIRFLLVMVSLWIIVHAVAIRLPNTTFPTIPWAISRQVIAVIFTVTFFAVVLGGKMIRPLFVVIMAPLWIIPVIWSLIVWTDWWSWWVMIFFSLIPHVVFCLTVWSRTMYGFTSEKIFVTVAHFDFYGVRTITKDGNLKEFKQSSITTYRPFGTEFGRFDPGLLQLGGPEEVVASFLPNPNGFKWALRYLQSRAKPEERK